jgi:hypothetical protein
MRLVGFALLAVLAYGLIFGLLFLAFHGLFDELLATQAAQAAAMATGAQPPPPSPAMIVKFLALEAVLIPVMIVLQFIYMVGFAEVSMRATPPIAALSLAAGGVFRNILKLVLFLFCFGMVLSVGMMIVFLVFGLVAMLLAFVSPVLAIVVIAIAYVVFLAFVYPMMFAMHYYMWKAMLGDEAPASPQPGAVAA